MEEVAMKRFERATAKIFAVALSNLFIATSSII